MALTCSALYFLSDVIEAIHGGFSESQLWLPLVAEAAIPVFVMGLYIAQRPQIGRLGRLAAAAYANTYAFFTGTVVYAPIHGTSDYVGLGLEQRGGELPRADDREDRRRPVGD
jgi:hypothetical protein